MKQDLLAAETRDFVSNLTKHQGILHSFIVSLMPGRPDAGDVLQETNVTLWEKMGDFQPGTDFKAWAMTVAKFKVLAHLKKTRSDQRFVAMDDELLERITQASQQRAESSAHELKVVALNDCMQRLKPKDRELLHARYQSQDTLDHYANRVNRPVASLYVTLGRLRTVLKQCVRGRMKKEGLA